MFCISSSLQEKLSADGPVEQTEWKSRCFYDGCHRDADLGACDRDVPGSFLKNPVVNIH